MSRGSYLTIYKKLNTQENALFKRFDKLSSDDVNLIKQNYLNCYKDAKECPKLIPVFTKDNNVFSEEAKQFYYSLNLLFKSTYTDDDGELYVKFADCHFTSEFTCLAEEFELDFYSITSYQKIIPILDVFKLNQAASYLLAENYCKKTEILLNNQYIDLLGEYYNSYYHFKYKTKNDIDDVNYSNNYIKNISTFTSLVLNNEDSDDSSSFVLVYEVYG